MHAWVRARAGVCVHMHDRICMHTQKIIFKVGPLSSDDFANHLFPVLL